MIFGAMATCLSMIALLNLAIGAYVFKQQPKSISHGSFAFLALATTLWTIGLVLGNYIAPLSPSLRRFTFATGTLVPLGVLAWATTFPPGSKVRPKILLRAFIPLALLFCGLSLSPWIVASVVPQSNGFRIVYGWLHPFFAAYILSCLLTAFLVLVFKYRENAGLLRLQIRHLLLALSIPGMMIATTNVLVPLVFGTSAFGKYGPIFSLLMVGLIAHAILRHRLMDIRIVVKQGAVYLAAFAVAGATFAFLLVGSNLVLPDEHWFTPLEILLALGIAVLFDPLKSRIQLAFDRYLYREPYDHHRIIRETSRALSNTIDLPIILDCVGTVIRDIVKPEWAAVYLLGEDEAQLSLAWETGERLVPEQLASRSAIANQAATVQALVFRDELVGHQEHIEPLTEMDLFEAEVAAPLLGEGQLFGLIVLGPKRSGNPYFSDDADLLQILAHQSAVAIRNAQTHQRVLLVNEELQKTLATIESGVVAVGPRGRVNVFNKAAELLTGRLADALLGCDVDQLPPVLGRLIKNTLADGQPQSNIEIALPGQAGQMIPITCTVSPLRGPHGARAGAVAVFTDLSRLKELERERRRAERLASLEAIASGMVHEIRNPLVSIKAFTQLLPSRFDDAEFRRNFTRVVGREINRMDGLLDRFRMLAAASRQPMEAVNVMIPLDDTLSLLQPQLEERGVALRRVIHGACNPVVGNVSQMEQLFLNLCLNALEAMESGGELTVRVADLSQGGGSTLLVEFSDTGCGIPEDIAEQIFNPFVTTKAKGTGLGLAICRAIADAHKAVLRARNHPDRAGCTFTVEFPVPSPKPTEIPT